MAMPLTVDLARANRRPSPPITVSTMRKWQIAALKEQSRTRAAMKIGHTKSATGQGEIFQSLY
jgi:hypothetical protein